MSAAACRDLPAHRRHIDGTGMTPPVITIGHFLLVSGGATCLGFHCGNAHLTTAETAYE
jgi:hypothetical protein